MYSDTKAGKLGKAMMTNIGNELDRLKDFTPIKESQIMNIQVDGNDLDKPILCKVYDLSIFKD
jgi:hypothetical protein